MNVNAVIYDPQTGELLRSINCRESGVEKQAKSGEAWMIGQGKPGTHYVDLRNPVIPQIRQRINFGHAVSVSGQVATVSSLPQPCTVHLDGVRHDVPDGALEVEFDLPGRYTLTLEHPHYMTATVDLVI